MVVKTELQMNYAHIMKLGSHMPSDSAIAGSAPLSVRLLPLIPAPWRGRQSHDGNRNRSRCFDLLLNHCGLYSTCQCHPCAAVMLLFIDTPTELNSVLNHKFGCVEPQVPGHVP